VLKPADMLMTSTPCDDSQLTQVFITGPHRQPEAAQFLIAKHESGEVRIEPRMLRL
jgi:hypothetical protein